MPRRAIFVDRDGTLCESNGPVTDARQLRLMPDAGEAIRRLNHGGWQVIVVTDQPALAFDEIDEDGLAEIHEHLRLLLLEEGARLDGIYHCPHHPEARVERYRRSCTCRGPGVALFERARDEMGIDLHESVFVSASAETSRAVTECGFRAVLDSIDAAADWALEDRATSGMHAR